jgi:hypothetical protein
MQAADGKIFQLFLNSVRGLKVGRFPPRDGTAWLVAVFLRILEISRDFFAETRQ